MSNQVYRVEWLNPDTGEVHTLKVHTHKTAQMMLRTLKRSGADNVSYTCHTMAFNQPLIRWSK